MNPRRILVVDDEPAMATLVVNLLQTINGWDSDEIIYITVGTLKDALHIINQGALDIVILDLKLPDSKMEESLTQVVKVVGRETVIVVISGGITLLDGYNALTDGADDFVLKGGFMEDNPLSVYGIKKLPAIVSTSWLRKQGLLRRLAIERTQSSMGC